MITHKIRLNRDFDIVKGFYGGSQNWFKSRYNVQTGCGPVALTNSFAWLSGMSLELEEMKELQEKVQNYLKGPVIYPEKFIQGARKFFQSEGYEIETEHLTLFRSGSTQRKKLILFIAAALEDNRPPALLLGPNTPGSAEPGQGIYRKDFSSHWVLITGLDVTGDDAVLTVSSWGSEFQLELGQLLKSKVMVSCVSLKIPGQN